MTLRSCVMEFSINSLQYLYLLPLMFVSDRLIGQPESRARGHNRPQQVLAIAGHFISDISVGSEHTLALTCDGEVWAWGNNSDGQLGVGHTVAVREPQLVGGLGHDLIKQVT